MYNEYFGFNEPPFSIAPDPRYLYMTAQHREALAHLVYGLNSDGGCILLTGEVGTGKTTICRCLLEQIPEKINVALVLNPKISELELLETICDELHISYPEQNKSIKTFTDRINQFLIERNAKNERTVLIIDEAQNLDSTVLEQLRLLTNLETEQRKLLQIIILGQPELLDILATPEMRQLAQRITARYHLNPLSREEIKAYINHRLAIAGQNIQLFPEKTITQLYRLSNGIPRLINIICDRALLGCYVENNVNVDTRILKKAADEVSGELKKVQNRNKLFNNTSLLTGMTVAILVIAIAILVYKPGKHEGTVKSSVAEKNVITRVTTTPDGEPDKPVVALPQAEQTKKMSDSPDTIAVAAVDTKAIIADAAPVDMKNGTATEQSVQTTNIAVQQSPELDDIIKNSSHNSKPAAYQTLFEQWQIPYDINSQRTACQQAQQSGLRCLHKQGNLNSLLQHNRPAVLKMFTPSGDSAYATLIRVRDRIATLEIKQQLLEVDTSTLDQYWLGQYTLLWRQPENYNKAVRPDKTGKLTDWLRQSFSRIYKSETGDDTSPATLLDAVKQFQKEQGLTADGVVGPVTIIHINTALGMAVPVLKQ